MQSQPRSDDKSTGNAQRESQAARIDDDTFKGGVTPARLIGIKSPWMIGTGRLWNNRRRRVREE